MKDDLKQDKTYSIGEVSQLLSVKEHTIRFWEKEFDCIHPKKDEPAYATSELLYIDPVECIDCGACVPVCPVSAIFALDDLPEKWAEYTAKNAAYYGK